MAGKVPGELAGVAEAQKARERLHASLRSFCAKIAHDATAPKPRTADPLQQTGLSLESSCAGQA